MSEKWSKCESNRKLFENNENNKSFDCNNSIKSNDKTSDDCIEPSTDGIDLTTSPSNGRNPCKVCNNEDPSAQFFASGPFYAIEAMAHNKDTSCASSDRRERSDKCNVLYAEMPHIFNDGIDLGQTRTLNRKDDNCEPTEDRQHLSNALDRHFGDDYQLFCYNCCSPLSLNEDSHINHKLYYISTNSDSELKPLDQEVENRSSSLSSPIMLKFCRESGQTLSNKSDTDDTNCSSKDLKTAYTTVIKPKAVRPNIAVNFDEMSSHSSHSALPTISYHGSANVLTDRDESAFTQIPRRRSNSEATHHYQSIRDNNNGIPSSSRGYSRPLQRHYHQRSKSVNKTFVDSNNSLGFLKFGSMNDKHLTRRDGDPNGICFNRNGKRSDINSSTSSQMQSSEPIHMSLEEVKSIFTKNQSKFLKNGFSNPKTKRNLSEIEDKNPLNKSKSKSKLKSAFEIFFRHKRRSESERQLDEYNPKEFEESFASNQCSQDSASPFTHRALPPLPSHPIEATIDVDNGNDDRTEETAEEVTDETNANEILSKEEEDRRQKFLDYAASIERVKDCGWYWGPISGEMAEKLLASEPCGSFIVRDSSDEHYIFSLTFKLNGMVRHVRIEHDQGNFSFGSLQKFRSNTIVDFIENAVEHSRSGRFLFFLHRRPVMGPMRVQLLHPVSRFKQIQSLQHMCRFIILKHVRRDLIQELPLPQMLKQYLNTPYYYSEELALLNREEANPDLKPDPNRQQMPPNTSH